MIGLQLLIRLGGLVWIFLELEGGLEIALLAELGEDVMSIAVEMLCESAWPNIHSFLQSGEECIDASPRTDRRWSRGCRR